ncbi:MULTISPECIES: sporulation integral membrane protein YlbJ [Bacillus]|uniref:sporulation integral membrane protein YlbJ n=1 Tax=Bacillus TaxID=1386 RepID=UPI0005D3F72E|nr:sporulation integral membrane protein YlbJ [Bacillus altitudinis]KQL47523.1 sporulation integral membrane protein YlbJ [Bacillus sp. FJAT-21955]MDN0038654.1 sporulation integral membrane protein YlbJ [Bacillus aerophilus]KJF48247.1 sporulation protein [Bacillus altitudinis]MDF9416978.1 sporulation integral membrane protein YlbJ [Bacillus altitudinis]MED0850241.1 sporulation integral membrane protein YlbJ [Bacillus altitudinis]
MKKWNTLFIAAFFIFLTATVITHPQASLQASKNGLAMWWEVVFPSLLPFFILSELLISFGIVRFVGVLLEPFMRPIFRVPGVGGFVLAMGMASGFPSGAKLTTRLRQEGQLTRIEAERLVSFTNSSNPLFIFGAVAVGFFHHPAIGIVLACAHYLGNLAVGVTMRGYKARHDAHLRSRKGFLLPPIREAFSALHTARLAEKRPLGQILSDAVMSSVQTLFMIGGFIILFSVFSQMLAVVHVTDLLSIGIGSILKTMHLPPELDLAMIAGLFEITLGSQLTGSQEVSMLAKTIVVSFILGFSGFSVQAQVAGILAATDIRFKPFFFARLLHGIYAAVFTFLLFKPLYVSKADMALPAGAFETSEQVVMFSSMLWNQLVSAGPLITLFSLIVYIALYYQKLKNG